MQNTQDLYAVAPDAVNDDIRRPREHQFPCPADPARPAEMGKFRKTRNRVPNRPGNGNCSRRIIAENVIGDRRQVVMRERCPFEVHEPAFSAFARSLSITSYVGYGVAAVGGGDARLDGADEAFLMFEITLDCLVDEPGARPIQYIREPVEAIQRPGRAGELRF